MSCLGVEPLPDPYRGVAVGNDRDDADSTHFRFMPSCPHRGGDGVGAGPRQAVGCLGTALPPGTSLFGFDPDDGDPARRDDLDAEALLLTVF